MKLNKNLLKLMTFKKTIPCCLVDRDVLIMKVWYDHYHLYIMKIKLSHTPSVSHTNIQFHNFCLIIFLLISHHQPIFPPQLVADEHKDLEL